MITHIERPILAAALSRISASDAIMKSEQYVVNNIMQEINKNKNVINLDRNDSNALLGILEKHIHGSETL